MNHRHHHEPELDLDEIDADFESSGTIGELATELADDDEAGPHYLRARWIAQAIAALRHARHESGQSQQDIAEALGTKQPAIARLERGDDITLGRMWDYLHACGKTPMPIAIGDALHDAGQSSDDTPPLRERQRRVG